MLFSKTQRIPLHERNRNNGPHSSTHFSYLLLSPIPHQALAPSPVRPDPPWGHQELGATMISSLVSTNRSTVSNTGVSVQKIPKWFAQDTSSR